VLRGNNTPEQKRHLGGPESEAKLLERHARYLRETTPGRTRMFEIAVDGQLAGSIGYWEREWDGGTVYETGWEVLPEFQGRGIGGAAAALLIALLRREARHRFLHAYPGTGNGPSNSICRRNGFLLRGERDVEYPPGRPMRVNDWRLDLEARREG
jgi:RimJ/RimL family protein N-acetyltransferase